MKLKTMKMWCGVFVAALLVQSAAMAGVAVSYVKTLGQSNVKGQPFKTSGSRISTDKDGNLYLCGVVANPWNMLVKMAPNGRVIWESPCGGYAAVTTALDEKYVYTVSKTMLNRSSKASGKLDESWGYGNVGWGDGTTRAQEGFPVFKDPTALLASDDCLYVVDRGSDEVKCLDKETGKEKKLANRLMMVAPVDIAKAKNGKLLVLTAESVFEAEADGKLGQSPLISGLSGAAAIDVEPAEGKIYIALGGTPDSMVNTINEYSADGKATGVKLGHGGGYSGTWAADQFAFTTGCSDISVDSKGGIWVSTSSMSAEWSVFPIIVHFDSQRKQDGMLMGVSGKGLAVDSDLSVYVSGTCKISWDNKPVWTSGLVNFGDMKQYPTTGPTTWWFTVAYADATSTVVFNPAAQTVMALSSTTGALLSGPHSIKLSNAAIIPCSAGKSVYYATDNGIEKLDVSALDKSVNVFKAPGDVKLGVQGLCQAASADGERFYCVVGDKVVGYGKDGAKLWEAAGRAPIALMNDMLWACQEAPGVIALDAKTGQSLCVAGDKEVDGRLPLFGSTSIATGSKDGKNYLFVGGQFQIQVFEVNAP